MSRFTHLNISTAIDKLFEVERLQVDYQRTPYRSPEEKAALDRFTAACDELDRMGLESGRTEGVRIFLK